MRSAKSALASIKRRGDPDGSDRPAPLLALGARAAVAVAPAAVAAAAGTAVALAALAVALTALWRTLAA
jgi:hypothetical protein